MVSVRFNTFETNSSSCHSITFNNMGEIDTKGITEMVITAKGSYCGSENYGYDEEYDFYYDLGDFLTSPIEKMNYAIICFVEYLNRRARIEDKEDWYKKHKDSNVKFDRDKPHKTLLPLEVYNSLLSIYETTKDSIIDFFGKKGIKVDWQLPKPTDLDEINSEIDKPYSSRLLIEIDGYIDHDSSCFQHEPQPWKLAELCQNPEKLFDFVFRPTNKIFIQYCG